MAISEHSTEHEAPGTQEFFRDHHQHTLN